MKRRGARVACVVLASLASAALAQAQPAIEEHHRLAAESFRQAQAAFGRRDFAAAAAAFEQAARFEPHPSPLLNAEEAWERAGELARAADDCDQVRAMAGANNAFRAEAESRLVALAPRIATVELRGASSVQARADGGEAVAVPARRRLMPGHHVIEWTDTSGAKSGTVAIDVAAGEIRTLELGVEPRPPAGNASAIRRPRSNADRAPAPGRGVPAGSWIAFGIGGASVVVAAVFGGLTVAAKSSYNGNPTQENADVFHRDKLVTNVAIATAGVSLATGILVWLVAPRRRSPPPAASASR